MASAQGYAGGLKSSAVLIASAAVGLGGCAIANPTRSAQPAADRAAIDLCAGLGPPTLKVVHHDVRLSLSATPPALAGEADVWVQAVRPAPVIALDAAGLEVESVWSVPGMLNVSDNVMHWPGRGEPYSVAPGHSQQQQLFEASAGRLCIDRELAAGALLRLRIRYRIDGQHAEGRAAPVYGRELVWAGYQAAAWVPTLQDPAQRATITLRLDAPSTWTTAVSGYQHGLDEAPPFLYGWAAGDFDERTLDVDGVTLRALGPRGAHLAAVNALTAPMLRFLTKKTGAKYPALTYTQVFVPGNAAQEAAGLSFLSADSITDVEKDPTEDWIFLHELAHQWFGWLVPCADFADFWLNEGFATFLVAAYKEEKWGRPAYERELGLWRGRSDKVHAAGKDAPLSLSGPNGPFPPAARGAPPRRGPQDSELQARGITYARGALLLDKLRCDLGDAVFWDGISLYVKAGRGAAPGGGSVRSDDLRAALEAASGRDLKALWAERVYAPFFDWPSSPCASRGP